MSSENPARESRKAYIALVAIIVVLAVTYFTLPISFVAFLLAPAIPGIIIALALGSIYKDQARKLSRVEKGEGVIARWNLDKTLWQEFERLNKGVIVTPRIAAKRLDAPGSAVEIIFAEDAVYVDGDYYTMDRAWGTMAVLHPAYLELSQGGLDYDQPVCVPIPAGLRGDAERIANHFNVKAV